MDELFSCRNCIHNASQSLSIGPGIGLCLKHDSAILRPEQTTCKYLHRKDLPRFTVDEGLSEHAAEFARFSGLVDLNDQTIVVRVPYSEQFAWEQRAFDPVVHSLAQYSKTSPGWVFIQASTGGVDGRRALTHAGLVRRYMDRCGTWRSSYRLVLGLIEELDKSPCFDLHSLVLGTEPERVEIDDAREQARWDVFFTKLGAVQEYGFHSGLEPLMWAADSLNGTLSSFDWEALVTELGKARTDWTQIIIEHAQTEQVFFPKPDPDPREDPFE